MSLILRELNESDEAAFLEGLESFKEMELDWYSFIWKEGMPFSELLKISRERAQGINLAEGRVPDSMLYAFVDGKIVGRSSVRHELNDYLKTYGGHVGYAVAPAFRKQGYATEILKQSMVFCREKLKLERILVTCDDDNVASIKTIEKNGGKLDDRFFAEDGSRVTRRYWIKLT